MRRSESAPISASAIAITSAAMATGSAWKLPPERISSPWGRPADCRRRRWPRAPARRPRSRSMVEDRAHHLRLAAQGVGVLDPVAVEVRGADAAAGEQRAQARGHLDLARLAAHRLDARIEGRVAPRGGVDRERACDQRRSEDILRREQAREGERGRDLAAVEQREPFLRRELERLQRGAFQAFGCGDELAPLRASPRCLSARRKDERGGRDRRKRRPSPWRGWRDRPPR